MSRQNIGIDMTCNIAVSAKNSVNRMTHSPTQEEYYLALNLSANSSNPIFNVHEKEIRLKDGKFALNEKLIQAPELKNAPVWINLNEQQQKHFPRKQLSKHK